MKCGGAAAERQRSQKRHLLCWLRHSGAPGGFPLLKRGREVRRWGRSFSPWSGIFVKGGGVFPDVGGKFRRRAGKFSGKRGKFSDRRGKFCRLPGIPRDGAAPIAVLPGNFQKNYAPTAKLPPTEWRRSAPLTDADGVAVFRSRGGSGEQRDLDHGAEENQNPDEPSSFSPEFSSDSFCFPRASVGAPPGRCSQECVPGQPLRMDDLRVWELYS